MLRFTKVCFVEENINFTETMQYISSTTTKFDSSSLAAATVTKNGFAPLLAS